MEISFIDDLFTNFIDSINLKFKMEEKSQKSNKSAESEDINQFYELINLKYNLITNDLFGPTLFAEKFVNNVWVSTRLDYNIIDKFQKNILEQYTNYQTSMLIYSFNNNDFETDIVINIYSRDNKKNIPNKDVIFVVDEFSKFLSDTMIGVNHNFRILGDQFGVQFIIPVKFTDKSDVFNYLRETENKFEKINKYIELVSELLVFIFLKESDDKIIEILQDKEIKISHTDKKSLLLSLYRDTGKITLPLPKNILFNEESIFEHYRELTDIHQAFIRHEEIYEDKISNKEKIENANILEFLAEMNFNDYFREM